MPGRHAIVRPGSQRRRSRPLFRYMVSVISAELPGVTVVRAWRRQAGSPLIVFMVLDALIMIYGAAGAGRNEGQQPIVGLLMWLALDELDFKRVPLAGLEPATHGLGNRCSIL